MAMVDKELEKVLWKDPLPLAKKILDAIVVGKDTVFQLSKEKETKRLFAGNWNGHWHLGDNDNAFSCNKIIRATKSPESQMHESFYFERVLAANSIHKGMFKPLDDQDPECAKFILEEFFALGSQLDLVKSRWTRQRNMVISHCWSLQEACAELRIDPWKFAIKANLLSGG